MDKVFINPEEKLAYCNTKYPVILVSGLGLHDKNILLDYWGTIPDYLKQRGCEVFISNQEAFTSIPDNAIKLKFRILDILENTKQDKINIIGHSKGGLEARYLASKLGMQNHISSITTLGTPHFGTSLADIILGKLPIPKIATARLLNIYARLLGDQRPDTMRAVVQVTTAAMKNFNEEVVDIPTIYYQSYASHINKNYPNLMWKTLASILKPFDGKNDGIVGIESSKWGNYRGLIESETCKSVSHGDMVGLTQFMGDNSFDHKSFFADMIHDLMKLGH